MTLSTEEMRGLAGMADLLWDGGLEVHQVTSGLLEGLGKDLRSLIDEASERHEAFVQVTRRHEEAAQCLRESKELVSILRARITQLEHAIGPAICEIDDAVKLAWPPKDKGNKAPRWHKALKTIGEQIRAVRDVYGKRLGLGDGVRYTGFSERPAPVEGIINMGSPDASDQCIRLHEHLDYALSCLSRLQQPMTSTSPLTEEDEAAAHDEMKRGISEALGSIRTALGA